MSIAKFEGKLVDYPILRILPFSYESAATMQLRNKKGEIMEILLKGELAENFLMEINMEVTYTVHGILGSGYDQTLAVTNPNKIMLTAYSIKSRYHIITAPLPLGEGAVIMCYSYRLLFL
jgi:hypothetical protein